MQYSFKLIIKFIQLYFYLQWKNFENGKVYSHKMPIEKKEVETHGAHRGPVVEERLLHSHHRDKKVKTFLNCILQIILCRQSLELIFQKIKITILYKSYSLIKNLTFELK